MPEIGEKEVTREKNVNEHGKDQIHGPIAKCDSEPEWANPLCCETCTCPCEINETVFSVETHFSVECKRIGKLITKHNDPRHSYTTDISSLAITRSLFTHAIPFDVLQYSECWPPLLYTSRAGIVIILLSKCFLLHNIATGCSGHVLFYLWLWKENSCAL